MSSYRARSQNHVLLTLNVSFHCAGHAVLIVANSFHFSKVSGTMFCFRSRYPASRKATPQIGTAFLACRPVVDAAQWGHDSRMAAIREWLNRCRATALEHLRL
jgi:hypothetical protein